MVSKRTTSNAISARVRIPCDGVHHFKEFEPSSGSIALPGSDLSEPGLISRRVCMSSNEHSPHSGYRTPRRTPSEIFRRVTQ
jgi:hypothetical protein